MKIQAQSNPQLKIYPKTYEDICDLEKWEKQSTHLGSTNGSIDELISDYRTFYKEAYPLYFDLVVKEVWLKQQLTFNGLRRPRRFSNGSMIDRIFGKFMKIAVGISPRILTTSTAFMPIASYLIDFFPNFLIDNPFKNPEKYKYPYKNVNLDQIIFVHQMDNRLEILEEAEKRSLSYAEFTNWMTNWVLCYNIDIGEEKYSLFGGHFNWVYVRNNKKPKGWIHSKFNFNVKHE